MNDWAGIVEPLWAHHVAGRLEKHWSKRVPSLPLVANDSANRGQFAETVKTFVEHQGMEQFWQILEDLAQEDATLGVLAREDATPGVQPPAAAGTVRGIAERLWGYHLNGRLQKHWSNRVPSLPLGAASPANYGEFETTVGSFAAREGVELFWQIREDLAREDATLGVQPPAAAAIVRPTPPAAAAIVRPTPPAAAAVMPSAIVREIVKRLWGYHLNGRLQKHWSNRVPSLPLVVADNANHGEFETTVRTFAAREGVELFRQIQKDLRREFAAEALERIDAEADEAADNDDADDVGPPADAYRGIGAAIRGIVDPLWEHHVAGRLQKHWSNRVPSLPLVVADVANYELFVETVTAFSLDSPERRGVELFRQILEDLNREDDARR